MTQKQEIGHWTALKHIWGGSGGCDVDDHVDDTPLQEQYYRNCPSYPQYSCDSSDLFNNYMDYVNHLCRIMYTDGQRNRSYAAFELFDKRKSFIKYQDDKYDPFVNVIYFVVNDTTDTDQLNVNCAYGDVPDFGLIDLNKDLDSEYQIIPCVQTTQNKYVDPVVDIQVVYDNKCDDVDNNETSTDDIIFVNTNLLMPNSDPFSSDHPKICYIKGDKDTDYDERILKIGFFESSSSEIENDWDLIKVDQDKCDGTNECRGPYEQCGGMVDEVTPYSGETCCVNGYFCWFISEWWSLCHPMAKMHILLLLIMNVMYGI